MPTWQSQLGAVDYERLEKWEKAQILSSYVSRWYANVNVPLIKNIIMKIIPEEYNLLHCTELTDKLSIIFTDLESGTSCSITYYEVTDTYDLQLSGAGCIGVLDISSYDDIWIITKIVPYEGEGHVGFLVDKDNTYFVYLDTGADYVYLYKMVGGDTSTITSETYDGDILVIHYRRSTGQFDVYGYNGKLFSATDTSLSPQYIGSNYFYGYAPHNKWRHFVAIAK